MTIKVREIQAKSILNPSRIPSMDYCVNPYVGCGHGCRYCYARFMMRFTHHTEPWGQFVDVKINAPFLLQKKLKRAKKGVIMLSSVTDAYQPLEKKYQLTRQCLEAILPCRFPIDILTKSALILRDLSLIKQFGEEAEVGFSIATDDVKLAHTFEPHAATIDERIEALGEFHKAGVSTYAFIGPILPQDPKKLAKKLLGKVDSVLIDRMNYSGNVSGLYKKMNLNYALKDDYFYGVASELKHIFTKHGVEVAECF